MQKVSNALKKEGKKIALIPTMGYLHEGHLSLLKMGSQNADIVVLSIFVNPTQFGPNEDYEKYPSDIDGDIKLAKENHTDIVFMPSRASLYPENFETSVNLSNITNHLCGLSRPTHFGGVALIVSKLFNIVKPNVAVFGQKDYQQSLVIKKLAKDLNFDIEIITAPIVREYDGLAKSSRNAYLNKEERVSALCLYKSVCLIKDMLKNGEKNTKKLISEAEKLIKSMPFTNIDYINICNSNTLEAIDEIKDEAVFALAVKVGTTRLIDNTLLKV